MPAVGSAADPARGAPVLLLAPIPCLPLGKDLAELVWPRVQVEPPGLCW